MGGPGTSCWYGTLLEGHAEHVAMVGPMVVPRWPPIRRRFDDRRHYKQPPLQRLVRALLGFDAKLSQYTRRQYPSTMWSTGRE